MPINTPIELMLPRDPPPDATPEEMRNYLKNVVASVQLFVSQVRLDFVQGSSMHRIFAAAPEVTDLEEGELVWMDDEAGTERAYTMLNGSLRYVNLT